MQTNVIAVTTNSIIKELQKIWRRTGAQVSQEYSAQ